MAQEQAHRVWWRKEAASIAHGHPKGPRLEQPRGAGQWAGGRGATPRTGGPGERGAGHYPGTATQIRKQGQGPARPLASRQRDPGPESRASLAQMSRLTTGASSPGHQTDRAQAAQASAQRELWGGPGCPEPRDAPHGLSPCPRASRPNPGPQQQLGPQRARMAPAKGATTPGRQVSKASSAGLRGLLPWLACVGGGLTQKEAGRVPAGPAGTLGRDSEV